MPEIKVLYVDDEESNLNSFRASFRRLYDIYTAISAKTALDILSEESVHVIISDQRMPQMTGVDFFKIIKETHPDPLRVLLTGFTDIEVLADAVNHGDIYRYITKPWNELELTNCIQNAHELYVKKMQLRQKVEELQKTNDELNRFIYSVSHELRAPLASAMGVINIAKLQNLFDEASAGSEYWNLIEECCNKLDYNISSTLQYYKNHRYQSDPVNIDFDKLTAGLVRLHKQANPGADQIHFGVTIQQPVPFLGDSFRTEIILGNLISNAIKYQDPENKQKEIGIEIKVDETEAVIKISDNGLGISDEQQPKLFTQFFRGNHNHGTGLGLFIVKEALTKINGSIEVRSQLNKGTLFEVHLPNLNK